MKSICLLIVQLQAKRSEEARESLRERNLKKEKREEVEEALQLVARSEKWKIRLQISQKLEDRYYQA